MKRLCLRLCATLTFILLSLVLPACVPGQGAGPSTWIDRPLDGTQVAMQPLTIEAHSSDANGVASVEFVVNTTKLGTVPTSGDRFVDASAGWQPTEPGTYVISVQALDAQGNAGAASQVHVTVGGVTATPTALPLVTDTATPVAVASAVAGATPTPPPAITVLITATPTPLPSLTVTPTPVAATLVRPTLVATVPPPPTWTPTATVVRTAIPTYTPTQSCPGVPVIAFFRVTPTTIQLGQSAALSWGSVSNAVSVEVDQDIGGVATPGSTVVTPNQTTTYTLTATGCGGTARAQVRLAVNRPSPTPRPTTRPANTPTVPVDNSGPSLSGINAAPNPIYVSGPTCPPSNPRNLVVRARVTDPSGVARVVVRWSQSGDSGEVDMGFIGDNVYQVGFGPFDHSGTLSFIVLAWDGVGNTSVSGTMSMQVKGCLQ